MTGDVWFKFYASDWVAGVSCLSASERGVYITLLAIMYDNGGPIVRDDARLARQCGLPKAGFSKCLEALISFGKITIEDGQLFNKRAKNELTEREFQKQNRAAVAQENANARWKKTKEKQEPKNANRIASGIEVASVLHEKVMPNLCSLELEVDNSSNLTVTCPKTVRTKGDYSEAFETFWKGYPTDANMSKKEAFANWKKLTPEKRELAIKSLPAFRSYCESNSEYRPIHACRYLSNERFEGHAKTAENLQVSSVSVLQDTPAGKAWEAYSRSTKGKGVPWTNGAWRFPTEYPPTLRAAE